MKKKYKKGIVGQIRAEVEQEKGQEHLRDKYDMRERDVFIVEKNNTVKFLIKSLAGFIRLLAAIAIFLLSVIGLAALIYPGSRQELAGQAVLLYQSLLKLLGLGG